MTALRAPRSFTLASLARFLRVPDASEDLSPLLGPGCIVLDLDASDDPLSSEDEGRVASALPTLPCVVIARATEPDSIWAARCDVLVEDDRGLDELLAGFAETPIAALCFVQLLRSRPAVPARGETSLAEIHAGLVSESFVYSTLQSGPEFRRWKETRKRRWLSRRSRAEPTGSVCRAERKGDRLEIVLTRPQKHNAFSRAMRDALCEALSLALVDRDIQVIVLRGEGASFCSGGDLDEFGTFQDPAVAHATRMTRSPAFQMARLADRIRCEVHGACLGAGIELPGFAHHIVADERAVFGLPELGLGLIPGAGGTLSLPLRIGRQRTAWLGLSGARIDARTALDWGLVDEVRLAHHPGVD